MLKRITLGAALLVAGAVPSFAQDACPAPAVPVVVDGATATRDQLVADIASVKNFIALSDTYQACIADYVAAQKAQADKDKKPMAKELIQAEGDKVETSQENKQKVGDAINASIGAYKKAHPT